MASNGRSRDTSTHPTLLPLSASAPLTPLELIQEQPEVERLTLPTGTTVFRAGESVQFIRMNCTDSPARNTVVPVGSVKRSTSGCSWISSKGVSGADADNGNNVG